MNLSKSPSIRLLTNEDIDQFREIRLIAIRSNPEALGDSHELEPVDTHLNWIAQPGSSNFVLGAFLEEKLVGVTGFYRQSKEKLAHKGMIWGVFVMPEARGKGIGKLLVEQALNRAEKLPDLSVIQLCVAEPNIEAVSLYNKLGFKEFGLEPYARKVAGRYISEIHMWKEARL